MQFKWFNEHCISLVPVGVQPSFHLVIFSSPRLPECIVEGLDSLLAMVFGVHWGDVLLRGMGYLSPVLLMSMGLIDVFSVRIVPRILIGLRVLLLVDIPHLPLGELFPVASEFDWGDRGMGSKRPLKGLFLLTGVLGLPHLVVSLREIVFISVLFLFAPRLVQHDSVLGDILRVHLLQFMELLLYVPDLLVDAVLFSVI